MSWKGSLYTLQEFRNPASDVNVDAIVIHHEVLGAILAHLVHLWPGRYPLIEDAVWLLEELLQHLQAAWTVLRIFVELLLNFFGQDLTLPLLTSNAHPNCMDWSDGGDAWRAHLAHHAIGKGGGHSQNKVDKERRDVGQVRIQVGHCTCPCSVLPICM